ncbi:extracellular solute-binding protein [Microbacterium sp. BWT-B31]|uniref:ABC transporter substrate-binding protein n=1 Tax=Microbacterium sp. BWT-B31 TaxID=3232072 RepID=UPI003528566E
MATGGWDAIVAAAEEEGQANALVTDTPAWQEIQTAMFKENTGLTMNIAASGPNADLETRVLAEIKSGNVQTDLMQDTDRGFYTKNADQFVDLSTLDLPNWDSYPESAKWQNLCVNSKMGVSGITYNTDLVPEDMVPDSWEDLTDPFWKDKIVLSNPQPGGYYMQWALMMREAFGDDFLEAIAAQNPTLDNSSVAAAEKVASGAALISFMSQADSAAGLIAKGAPLKFKLMRGPDIGSNVCVGILKDGPNPNAAAVLLNHLMSEESQSTPCKAGLAVVSPVDAEGCYEVPEDFEYPTLDAETGQYPGLDDEALKAEVLGLLGIG